ncbi:hypothetical protein CLU79DRAFT_759663, partial [Phycomyces nitens]
MVFCIYFCLALSESLLYSIVAYTNILIHYFLFFLLLFCQFVYFLNNTFIFFYPWLLMSQQHQLDWYC